MTDPRDQLIATLKKHSKSTTKSRLAVFEALSNGSPSTMQDLVIRLEPSIDRASVYRAVKTFESLGITHRVPMGWKYAVELADAFQPHHHHLLCTRCGNIAQIADHEKLEQLIRDLAKAESFTLLHHQVELQGICASCETSPKT